MITPKKIEYAREKEQTLFDSLSSLASMKQEEIKNLINSTIDANRKDILDSARTYKFVDIDLINISSSSNDEYLNIDRKNSSSDDFSSSGDYENRFITVKCAQDYKKCTSQVQELVINKLNNAIGQKLTESIEILKETYIGTLKRCLITLEDVTPGNARESNSESVSEALQQVICQNFIKSMASLFSCFFLRF